MSASRSHLENARKPRGEEGRALLDVMNAGTHEKLAAWALPRLALPRGARVLDVGCGGGANLRRLLERCPGAHATGVDYSPVSVAASRETMAEEIARGACEVVEGDVSALPFADGAFDAATAFETVYFWPDLDAGLAEIARVLAPGAQLLVVNETDGSNLDPARWGDAGDVRDLLRVYSPAELEQALARAGFADVSIEVNPETRWLSALARVRKA